MAPNLCVRFDKQQLHKNSNSKPSNAKSQTAISKNIISVGWNSQCSYITTTFINMSNNKVVRDKIKCKQISVKSTWIPGGILCKGEKSKQASLA